MGEVKIKHKIAIYVTIISLTLIDAFLNIKFKKLNLFPSTNFAAYEVYNESRSEIEGNGSVISIEETKKEQLIVKYEMRGDPHRMYSGIAFVPKESKYFDINNIDQIILNIKSNYGKRIPIYIICEYDLIKSDTISTITRPFEAFIDYSPSQEIYKIGMDEFATPTWWFTEYEISKAHIEGIKLDKIISVNIENCKIIKTGVEDVFQINEFILQAVNTTLYIRMFLVLVLGFSISELLFALFKKKKLQVAYKPTEIPVNNKAQVINVIADYFAANYMKKELSLDKASKELGISKYDISKCIKKNLGMSYKQYLNGVRIAEVKRLLNKSELSVSEIAYQVGYNNISHFNRIFKTETGLSPKEYRTNKS